MSGTKIGGIKAREFLKQRYGKDYYSKLGMIGGKARVPKGFAVVPGLAARAGRVGGAKSRRGPAIKHKQRYEGIK